MKKYKTIGSAKIVVNSVDAESKESQFILYRTDHMPIYGDCSEMVKLYENTLRSMLNILLVSGKKHIITYQFKEVQP